MGAVKALTADGLFIGQSAAFFELLGELAQGWDDARRLEVETIKTANLFKRITDKETTTYSITSTS